MGFYGNITNTARTQFQFDKVYSNRFEMDGQKSIDGIYAGRYVLVEYDSNTHLDYFTRVETKHTFTQGGITYYTCNYAPSASNNQPSDSDITKLNVEETNIKIVYTAKVDLDASGDYYAKNPKFYLYRPEITYKDNSALACFEMISETAALGIPNYTINYNIDIKAYGAGRGYDSTVWQKTYMDGMEKYIMIAELNTVVPTFDVSADAPSQSPIVPHFDVHSTDVYYKLHWQPTWGLRVKSAKMTSGPEVDENGKIIADTLIPYTTDDNFETDEITVWKKEEYNQNTGVSTISYWNPETQTWELNPSDIAAAIYYNRAGFSPEIIAINNDIVDKINIETTGKSGHRYNDHQGLAGAVSAKEDIQEITMMLPSIGNSIAKMWNVVYGDYYQNGGSNARNMDINWNSTEGLRLVKENLDGSGFTYEPAQVETLAGAINSVHDLMGMIVEEPKGAALDQAYAETADENKIYYSEGKYWRKTTAYSYDKKYEAGQTIDAAAADYIPVENAFKEFPANKFYYTDLIGVYNKETNDYPTFNRPYYANAEDESVDLFSPVSFDVYDKATWYRYDNNSIYSNLEEVPSPGVIYYQIQPTYILRSPYESDKYFIYTDEDGDKGLEIPENIDGQDLLDNNRFNICAESRFNPNYHYYSLRYNGDSGIQIKEILLFEITTNHFYKNLSDNSYVRCEDNKIPELADTITPQFYTIEITYQSDNFYYVNKYYTSNENNTQYKIYTDLVPLEDVQYYKRAEAKLIPANSPDYYVPSVYYYLQDNQYILDKNYYPTDGREYYSKGAGLYVMNDDNNLFNPGAKWNTNVEIVPDGITLGTRTAYPAFIELAGFARTMNTIHGLLIKINQKLLAGDAYTRDTDTVQGAINVLNDIIAKFEIINPGDFVIVDEYGRMHSAPCTSSQEFTSHNFGNNNDTQIDSTEDRWIGIYIDYDGFNPIVTVNHEFTQVEDSTTSSDKNNEQTYIPDSAAQRGLNHKAGDTLKLYTPIVDKVGHVVGHNEEEVTLPFGYKTFTTNALSTNENQDLDNSTGRETIADNTQDELSINTINKWIQLEINNDEIDIAHEIHNIDTTALTSNLNIDQVESINNSDKITIQDVEFDNAGHVIENHKHTYTLPYSYKTFKTNGYDNNTTDLDVNTSSQTVANSTQDTISINTYNKWIQTKFTDDKLEIAHEVHNVEVNPLTSNLNNDNVVSTKDNDKITFQDLEFDAAGHVIVNRRHTYTLPYAIKTVSPAPQSINVSNPEVNETTIVAENTQDNLVISSSNKWIRMSADADTDTFYIGHETHYIETVDKDNTDLDDNQEFTVQDLLFDEAGHLTGNQKHTYRLPDNFKYIFVEGPSTQITGGAAASGTLEANNHIATATFAPGNRWITLLANPDNDKLIIGHASAGGAETTTYNINDEPLFGATFGVPTITYDGMGHITKVENHTVKLPLPSLVNGTGNVVTQLALDATSGKITETRANIGTLGITGYTTTDLESKVLDGSETLNNALGQLQLQITKEVNDRTAVVGQETADRAAAISAEAIARETSVNAEISKREEEIARLENLITELTNRIIELEEKIEEYHPSTSIT